MQGSGRGAAGKKCHFGILENQMEKIMENEMETREYIGVIYRGCI